MFESIETGGAFETVFRGFITCHHFLSFMVGCTVSNGTATSFSPAPRKPPTPAIGATTFPDLSTKTSLMSRILFSLGS